MRESPVIVMNFNKPSMRQLLFMIILGVLGFNYIGINALRVDSFIIDMGRFAILPLLVAGALYRIGFYPFELILVCLCMVSLIVGGAGNIMALNALFLVILIALTKRLSADDFVGTGFFVLFMSLAAVVILLSSGVLVDSVDDSGERVRRTFGFSNVNAIASLVFSFILCLILRVHGSSLLKSGLSLMISVPLFLATDTKSLLLGVLLYFVFRCSLPLFSTGIISKFFLLVILAFPIVFTQLSSYISSVHPDIDTILSMRPLLFSRYIEQLPWYSYLIGGISPGGDITIDNAFLLIQGALGVPFLVYLLWRTFYAVDQYFQIGRAAAKTECNT